MGDSSGTLNRALEFLRKTYSSYLDFYFLNIPMEKFIVHLYLEKFITDWIGGEDN